MTGEKRKISIIYISSGDEKEEEEEYEILEIDDDDESEADDSSADEVEEDEEEEDYEVEDTDEDEESEVEESDGDEESSEDEEIEWSNLEDHEALCERVSSLLREGKDLKALSVNELKAYLRKHGIRLGGKKAVCVDRIREHWRISKGNAESLYPRSSFDINCTGDVCKGDVVLFRQKILKKNGNVIGMRTVAGRVVKESYGSARQQHTFTVEVLWSKGTKSLPPLFPLLVKGRNLYKLKTFRQRWNDEAERVQVLAEKHRRGTAARAIRAMKRSKHNQSAKRRHLNEGRKDKKCSDSRQPSESSKEKQAYGHKKNTSLRHRKTNNHHKNASSSRQPNLNENQSAKKHLNEGRKDNKCPYSRQTFESSKGKHAYGHKTNTSLQHQDNNHHQNASSSRQPNLRGNKRPNVGYSFNTRGPNHGHLNMENDPSLTMPRQMGFYNPNLPSHFSGHSFSSSPITHEGFSYRNDFHSYQSNPNYHIDAKRSFRQVSRAWEPYGQSRRGYQRFYP